jgi:membrane-bound serine protease (ClpP class)
MLKKLSLTFAAILMFTGAGRAQMSGDIVLVPVSGMVDNGLATFIDRSLEQAKDSGAKGLILHINTFGGLLDAADKIRTSLIDAGIPTVAYIDKNAGSAGALIALACDTILVAPGASVGAATVVEGESGNKASEKYQSYMRGIMRATAEAKNRDPRIAEAMVDERIVIEGLVDDKTLLTLSAEEAVKWGFADAEAASLDEVKKHMGWTESITVSMDQHWEESVLRFLANPVVSSVLMLMMMGGLYFELQTPGVGFPGIIAAIGATLFFAPLYLLGLAQSWEIVLFIIGVVLLVVEIFVIPGFGIAGFAGISLIVFSLGAALIGNVGLEFPAMRDLTRAIWTMVITLLLSGLLVVSLGRYLPENKRFNQLVLQEVSGAGGAAGVAYELDNLVGSSGMANTALRPAGIVVIDGRKYDVVSDGDFIEKGTPVKVVSALGNRIIVTRTA